MHSIKVEFLLFTQRPLHSRKFNLMLLRFIDGTGKRNVDRSLKMLIKPI